MTMVLNFGLRSEDYHKMNNCKRCLRQRLTTPKFTWQEMIRIFFVYSMENSHFTRYKSIKKSATLLVSNTLLISNAVTHFFKRFILGSINVNGTYSWLNCETKIHMKYQWKGSPSLMC
jgi:hypothetical protein